ncbi:hypothetical protein AGDE_15882 [Angomonas deanei]|uniref:C3H1-type domain-containing protein n=1 Tax=Angomonas deanei TaxID=59799 RepID=A0A7G2C1T2_9TRYP|nr:hypothetical protein AGDE_15882 [Angomonas deanei]CAD2213728.1 hypothetical protein, conserved [Angomonas deanei]|eukprot:EPY18215.1 hypothetical protein AGDE_15882 [Angomonas deanei]
MPYVPPPPLYYYPPPMMMMMPPPPMLLPTVQPPPANITDMTIPEHIAKLITPAFKPADQQGANKKLYPPQYYYEKILEAKSINEDPHFMKYAYEKYQPYQFRVRSCPYYKKGEPNSCKYGKNCFLAHGARNRRSVEVNMIGNLASVRDVQEWLQAKNKTSPSSQ